MDKSTFETAHMAALNPQQRAAVEAVDGAVLLLAVPGSGKTTVLITRLGYMTEVCGVAPESILTMTYTVAATREMRARFAARFGEALAARMEFRTINGVAARVIALYSRMYNRTAPELLQNESDTAPLLTKLWQDINHEYPAESSLKDLRTAITYIKNMCLTDGELDALESDVDNLPELYRGYQRALKAQRRMDYDDQLCFALQILRAAPAVAAAFRRRYKYFCVDESQDTSKVQHEIIRVLAQESGNIFMVGDEDQSIYGFRAAYPQALMDFEKTYPGAQILLMEENYRSREPILEAANRFVARNRYRRTKKPARRRARVSRFRSSKFPAVPTSCRFCSRPRSTATSKRRCCSATTRARCPSSTSASGGVCPTAARPSIRRFSRIKSCATWPISSRWRRTQTTARHFCAATTNLTYPLPVRRRCSPAIRRGNTAWAAGLRF